MLSSLKDGIPLDYFLDHVDEDFICGICLNVLNDPHQACSEGHPFCKFCLCNFMKYHRVCCGGFKEGCGRKLVGMTKSASAISTFIGSFKVSCFSVLSKNLIVDNESCSWVGTLKDFKTHVVNDSHHTNGRTFEYPLQANLKFCINENSTAELPTYLYKDHIISFFPEGVQFAENAHSAVADSTSSGMEKSAVEGMSSVICHSRSTSAASAASSFAWDYNGLSSPQSPPDSAAVSSSSSSSSDVESGDGSMRKRCKLSTSGYDGSGQGTMQDEDSVDTALIQESFKTTATVGKLIESLQVPSAERKESSAKSQVTPNEKATQHASYATTVPLWLPVPAPTSAAEPLVARQRVPKDVEVSVEDAGKTGCNGHY
jgi:hypothetical protein